MGDSGVVHFLLSFQAREASEAILRQSTPEGRKVVAGSFPRKTALPGRYAVSQGKNARCVDVPVRRARGIVRIVYLYVVHAWIVRCR